MANEFCICSQCGGTGRVFLTGVYADTLKCVKRRLARGGYIVANRDATWFQCKATALNNRLSWLEDNGFLESVKYGKQRRFYLSGRKPSEPS